ncbi:hypothetical protein [Actinoplanes italicus]|uniref:hypothetical protein n=1 Tax=Actinoplanes italicus TaxID=113567 RepID=UPI001944F1CB|nr:hypothetical protein [Actinoplanes italicus]
MGEPATPIRRRIELTVAEARLRFQQLVRVTGLTGQVTVLVDNGRPIAAIVPASDVIDNRRAAPGDPSASTVPAIPLHRPDSVSPASPPTSASSPPSVNPAFGRRPRPGVPVPPAGPSPSVPPGPSPAAASPTGPSSVSAEGWMRRIEKVREDVRRQHAQRIGELSQALDEAWRMLDAVRPPGTDRAADTLRATHADLRKAR